MDYSLSKESIYERPNETRQLAVVDNAGHEVRVIGDRSAKQHAIDAVRNGRGVGTQNPLSHCKVEVFEVDEHGNRVKLLRTSCSEGYIQAAAELFMREIKKSLR